jgi:hypothetical protein
MAELRASGHFDRSIVLIRVGALDPMTDLTSKFPISVNQRASSPVFAKVSGEKPNLWQESLRVGRRRAFHAV